MKLVANWKQAWRWSSMHAMTAAGAIQGAWLAIPDDMKRHIPTVLVGGITIGLLVFGLAGRLRDQTPKPKGDPHE